MAACSSSVSEKWKKLRGKDNVTLIAFAQAAAASPNCKWKVQLKYRHSRDHFMGTACYDRSEFNRQLPENVLGTNNKFGTECIIEVRTRASALRQLMPLIDIHVFTGDETPDRFIMLPTQINNTLFVKFIDLYQPARAVPPAEDPGTGSAARIGAVGPVHSDSAGAGGSSSSDDDSMHHVRVTVSLLF